mmetsp:Transcript_32203/g.57767  ORF Transcript_32203/g.57767 Transcript_32203/m.57767 type:complete len:238 (+) Transcript_32203:246-959(+)
MLTLALCRSKSPTASFEPLAAKARAVLPFAQRRRSQAGSSNASGLWCSGASVVAFSSRGRPSREDATSCSRRRDKTAIAPWATAWEVASMIGDHPLSVRVWCRLALAARRACTLPTSLERTAASRGVTPLSRRAKVWSAPRANSTWTTRWWPLWHASSRGVTWPLVCSRALGWAPLSSSSSIRSGGRLARHATLRGLALVQCWAVQSARASISRRARQEKRCMQASIKAVQPLSGRM